MKNLLVCLIACSLSSVAVATSRPDESAAAHIGTAYAINTISYGAWRKIGMSRTEATLFAAFTTSIVGAVKEFHDYEPNGNDLLLNTVGIGLSAGTVFVFGF